MKPTISQTSRRPLKVSFPFAKPISSIDPQNIQVASEAILVQNLYARLIDLNNDGQLKGSMASDFYWDGHSYVLTVRRFKTAGDKLITAEDAYYSLKRIIALDKNTHGSLKMFLCPSSVISNLNDPCPGIRWQGDKLWLTPHDVRSKSFIIPLLASVDFSMMSKDDLDFAHPNRLNNDLKNTTGLYFVSEDSPSGRSILEINKHHFLYNDKNFSRIELIPGVREESLAALKAGLVDYITTIARLTENSVANLKIPNLVIHKTLPISLDAWFFTDRGMRHFSQMQRIALGEKMRTLVLNSPRSKGKQAVRQFFPPASEGRLNIQQEELLAEIRKKSEKVDLSQLNVSVVVPQVDFQFFTQLFSNLPHIKIKPPHGPPWTMPENEKPDMYFCSTDSSFFAELPLISYNFSVGSFGTKEFGDKWLEKFITQDNKELRLKMVKDLHFKILSEGRIVPIFMTPFIAVSTRQVEIKLSKYYAGNPFSLVFSK